MRVVLHIGATKTGSSALQVTLHDQRADLLAAGALYPLVGMRSCAHHLIAAAIHPSAWRMHLDIMPADKQERRARFDDMIVDIHADLERTGADILLLSSEYWWASFAPDMYRTLVAAFSGARFEVVAFVRRPEEWAVSSYLQAVKSGETRDFSAWAQLALLHKNSGLYSFQVLDNWAHCIQSERVSVLRYETTCSNVYRSFCKTIGLNVETEVKVRHVNPSPTREGLKLLLAINRSDACDADKAAQRHAVMIAHQAPGGTGVDLVAAGDLAPIISAAAQSEALLERAYTPSTFKAPPADLNV